MNLCIATISLLKKLNTIAFFMLYRVLSLFLNLFLFSFSYFHLKLGKKRYSLSYQYQSYQYQHDIMRAFVRGLQRMNSCSIYSETSQN